MALPTRTSSDPNAAADINSLQSQITALSGGSGLTQFDFKPGDLYFPTSNPAPLDTDTGTNGSIKRYLFDDSTDESVEGVFLIPSSWSTSGTMSIDMVGYPVTAAANDIVMDFQYSTRAEGESWDAAYTSATSAFTCSATTDILKVHTISVAKSAFTANDQVRFKVVRDADNGNDTLVGDWGMTSLRMRF